MNLLKNFLIMSYFIGWIIVFLLNHYLSITYVFWIGLTLNGIVYSDVMRVFKKKTIFPLLIEGFYGCFLLFSLPFLLKGSINLEFIQAAFIIFSFINAFLLLPFLFITLKFYNYFNFFILNALINNLILSLNKGIGFLYYYLYYLFIMCVLIVLLRVFECFNLRFAYKAIK